MYYLALSIFSLLLGVGPQAFANDEEIVASTHRAGAAYLFVTPSKSKASDREPGVYSRATEGGEWQLIIKGNTTPTRTSPLFMELPITAGLKNYESLAIVDGRLVLFHIDSRADDPDSYLIFGESVRPIDVVTETEFELPIISKSTQVAIQPYTGTLPDSAVGQLVLVTIAGDPEWDGSTSTRGLTFAFSVATTETRPHILMNPPLALDNQAYPPSQLSQFIQVKNQRPRLISHFLDRKNARLTAKESASFLQKWSQQIKESLLGTTSNPTSGTFYIDPVTLEERQGEPLAEILFNENGFRLLHDYQVNQGLRTLVVAHEGYGEKALANLAGPIDTLGVSDKPLIISNVQLRNQSNLIFGHAGKLYLAQTSGLVRPSTMIDYDSKVLEIATKSFTSHQAGIEYLVLSLRTETGDKTYLLKYQTDGRQSILLFARPFIDRFYSEAELRKRIVTDTSDDSEEGEVFFNAESEILENQLRDNVHAPVFALERATHQEVEQILRQPLSRREVFPENSLSVYKEYSRAGERQHQKDGIYQRKSADGREVQIVRGKVLPPPDSDLSIDRLLWTHIKMEHKLDNKRSNSYRVGAYQIDVGDGQTATRLTVESSEKDVAPLDVQLGGIITEYKIEELRLIPNFKKNDVITLLTRYSRDDKSIVTYRAYRVSERNKTITLESVNEQTLYSRKAVVGENLPELIFFDDNKTPYLISNGDRPDVDQIAMNPWTNRSGRRTALKLQSLDEVVSQERENNASVLDTGYTISLAYEWILRNPSLTGTEKTGRPSLEAILKKPPAPFGFKTFYALDQLIDSLALASAPNRHVVMVIPDDLKPVIEKMMIQSYLDGKQKKEWSLSNGSIVVGYYGNFSSFSPIKNVDGLTQDKISKYLKLTGEARGKKPVMVVDAEKLIQTDRPIAEDGEEPIFIPDYVGPSDDGDESPRSVFAEANLPEERVLPHALYWLATEGRGDVPINRISEAGSRKDMSTVLLASETEWKRLKTEARPEFQYGIEEHFEVFNLGAPTREEQVRLIKGVLQASNVGTSVKADLTGIRRGDYSDEEAMEIALSYFVTKLESLTAEKGQHALVTFSEALARFTQVIKYDRIFLREKKIDRRVFEKVFTQIFSLPLNPRLLPAEDPLRILMQPNIATQIQNVGGYAGSFDVINKVVGTLKTQMQPQTTKALPGSILMFGPTSTGKTSLFLSFVKALGLRMYDWKEEPTSEGNRRANAMIISCSKLTDEANPGTGLFFVDDVLAIIEHQLSQPEGYRLNILFDDVHAAPDAVRAKLVSWMRMTMDSEGGVKLVQSKFDNGDPRTIPVRNIGLWMSINPPDDNEKIKKYSSKTGDPKPEELALAALSGTNVQVDSSFLARWGLFLNMSLFPTDAKAPSLIGKLMQPLRSTFEKGVLATVSMGLIEKLVAEFKDMHARDFLAGGVNGIIDVAEEAAGLDTADANHSALIVVPNSPSSVVPSEEGLANGKRDKDRQFNEQDVSDWIRNNTVAMSVDSTFEGKLLLLDNMVNRFRSDLFMALTMALQADQRLASAANRHAFLSQAEQAFLDHIDQNTTLPLSALSLSPTELGLGSGPAPKAYFERVLSAYSADIGREKYFPQFFYPNGQASTHQLDQLIGRESTELDDRQAAILRDFASENADLLMELVYEILRTEDVEDASEDAVTRWFERLKKEVNPQNSVAAKATYLATSSQLIQRLLDLNLAINSVQSTNPVQTFNFYQVMRLFLFAVDRAISKMPWDNTASFVAKMMTLSTHSLDLAESPEVHRVLFGTQSLIIPGNLDQARQHLESSSVRKSIKPELKTRLQEGFKDCEAYLTNGPKPPSERPVQ